jgi:hypothetical protein
LQQQQRRRQRRRRQRQQRQQRQQQRGSSSMQLPVLYSSAKPGVMHRAKILFSNLDERLYIGDMVPLAL